MISMVSLERMVMDDGVRTEWIIKAANWFMHDVTMERPFKKGRKDYAEAETNRRPKNEML